MDIGFIGLGSMGSAMVENLLKAGHRVRVWNRSPERAQALAGLGAQVVGTPAEVGKGLRQTWGGVAGRITLYAPYQADPTLLTEVLDATR